MPSGDIYCSNPVFCKVSCLKGENNEMGMERGILRGNNQWIKAEGRGLKQGFVLKDELEKENAIQLPAILEHSSKQHGNERCMGARKILERKKIEVSKKIHEKLVLGEYHWKSYTEVHHEVIQVAVSLVKLGYTQGDKIAIIAETRAEWFILAMACLKIGMTLVTLYTNLNDASIIHAIDETEVNTIISSYEVMPRLSLLVPKCKLLKKIIILEDELEGMGDVGTLATYEITSYKSLNDPDNSQPLDNKKVIDNEDIAIIMYTSGSTGNPKGVLISHSNIFSAITAYAVQANLGKKDIYIAYLPLAHILELATEIALIAMGVTIAYSSPHTLTNNSPKIAKGTLGDARVVKPTCMSAVPLILDRIIKGVSQKVEQQGRVKNKIFKEALKYKQTTNNGSLINKILDMAIFNKVKGELGGNLKMMAVGGAPLSAQTHSMIVAMFGCTLQPAYGCTETAASVTSADYDDTRTNHSGSPNLNVIVKLEDWEEGEYRTTDKPRPRGEVVIGGPSVTKGYYKLPEETKKAFYEENGIKWFRSGDIGEFDDSGVLYIIDRKKDLVKLKHGEYVSLGNIESLLKTNSIVENICVVAHSEEENTVAIIVPATEPFRKLCNDIGFSTEIPIEALCEDEKVTSTLQNKLKTHGLSNGLSKWDIPAAVYITVQPWTPDNGFVTASLKIRRRVLEKNFKEEINSLYENLKN